MDRPQKITFAEMRAIWLSLSSRNTPTFAQILSLAGIHVGVPLSYRHFLDLAASAGAIIDQPFRTGGVIRTDWWFLLENFHPAAHAACCQKQN
jgi:hypothetical protein